MATAAPRAIASKVKLVETEKIIDFTPELLKAPFMLRCAALFVDYLVLIAPPVIWLLISTSLSDVGNKAGIGTGVWILGICLFLADFLLLPSFRGQTIGKMLTGITILNLDGTYLSFGGVLKRNIFGYLVTVLTLGIGFIIAALNTSGRSLHDFTGGTVVVHGERSQL